MKTKKEIFQKILCMIFWNFLKFHYMFYYPEMKQNLISSIKIVVYKLPQEFSNDFQKSYNLRKLGDIRKSQTWVEAEPGTQYPFQKKLFDHTSQKLRKTRTQSFLLLSGFACSFYFLLLTFFAIVCPNNFFDITRSRLFQTSKPL